MVLARNVFSVADQVYS